MSTCRFNEVEFDVDIFNNYVFIGDTYKWINRVEKNLHPFKTDVIIKKSNEDVIIRKIIEVLRLQYGEEVNKNIDDIKLIIEVFLANNCERRKPAFTPNELNKFNKQGTLW